MDTGEGSNLHGKKFGGTHKSKYKGARYYYYCGGTKETGFVTSKIKIDWVEKIGKRSII